MSHIFHQSFPSGKTLYIHSVNDGSIVYSLHDGLKFISIKEEEDYIVDENKKAHFAGFYFPVDQIKLIGSLLTSD